MLRKLSEFFGNHFWFSFTAIIVVVLIMTGVIIPTGFSLGMMDFDVPWIHNQTAITNDQLCAQTKDLTAQMYAFQNTFTNELEQLTEQQMTVVESAPTSTRQQLWDQQTQALTQFENQETYDFQSNLLKTAIFIKDALLKRLPGGSEPTGTQEIAFEGNLAGASPVADAAIYLDGLSQDLCQ